jgi:N-acetylglucosaminyldiphosphoundecaprenol N-acetyl-beta-D-mannosaminyltransferase
MMLQHSFDLLGVRVDPIPADDLVQRIVDWGKEGGQARSVSFTNVNSVVESYANREFRGALREFDLSVPDGMPLVWVGRMLHKCKMHRSPGPDLMPKILQATQDPKFRHYFYGGTDETLQRLMAKVAEMYPALDIVGGFSPPFRSLTPEEEAQICAVIRDSGANMIWIGLGCPKQELWVKEHIHKLPPAIHLPVGQAFDILAGTRRRAPKWLRESGFEWLYRLTAEPKRLWKRYVFRNTTFAWLLLRSVLDRSTRLPS